MNKGKKAFSALLFLFFATAIFAQNASKKPNGYALYDMSGNVWEWCNDKIKGTRFRVKKGGSWSSDKELCALSFRGLHYPSRYQPCYTYFNMGFRLAFTK